MYCDMCGAQIPDNARFCRACGTALPDEASLITHPPKSQIDEEPQVAVASLPEATPAPDRTGQGQSGFSAEQEAAAQRLMAARSNDSGAVDANRQSALPSQGSVVIGKSEDPCGLGQALLCVCGVIGYGLVLGSFLWRGSVDPKYAPDAVLVLIVGGPGLLFLIRQKSFRWTLSFLGWLSLAAIPVTIFAVIVGDRSPGQGYYAGGSAFALACIVFAWAASTWGWYRQRNVVSRLLVGCVISYLMTFVILAMVGPIGGYLIIPLLSFILANR